MQETKEDLTVVMETPETTVRHETGFGSAADYGELAAEHLRLGAGTDLTPLLEGLEDDTCQCPHWGYVVEGEINVRYSDGSEEVDGAGDLFYWPPGHTLWVDEDTEFVLFSPQEDHAAVFEHIAAKIEE
ncbi:cupin domain-containing protein [Halomarina rubra]|uniref:Cupin domain-containing protein n=1 Tax=Halomarina rubra TaxID=2071873 RepID=A0ABD6B085_9EURY|nr:cupin domain-containing protein [Halomarina rubra]